MEFHITVQQYDKDCAGGWFDDVNILAQDKSIPEVLRRLAECYEAYVKEFGEPVAEPSRGVQKDYLGDGTYVVTDERYVRQDPIPPSETPAEETGKMRTPPPQETWPAEVTVTDWDTLRELTTGIEAKVRKYRRREL